MGTANEAANRDRRADEDQDGDRGKVPGIADARRADAVGSRPSALSAPPEHSTDDLKDIHGIGPVNEKRLHDLGIYTFAQIAAWGPQEIAWVNSYLSFPRRVEREDWVGQARNLGADGPPRQLTPGMPSASIAEPTSTQPAQSPEARRAAEAAAVAARLAALPANASAQQRADAVGARPAVLTLASGERPDDLTLIRGIGPVNETRLHGLGIYRFAQIAQWTRAEILWVGTYLAFPGRIDREGWVEQAKAILGGASGTPDRGKRK